MNCKTIIDDLCFNNPDFEVDLNRYSPTNPYSIGLLLKNESFASLDLSALKSALDTHNAKEASVSSEDIKTVYLLLKERIKNPRGTFDKQGRFYIVDYELIDCREPSSKYPYSQMNAARSAKFVKALAEKYKCQNIDELKIVAFK